MGTKSIRHIVEANVASFLAAETGLAGVSIYTGDAVDLNVLPKAIAPKVTVRFTGLPAAQQ